MGLAGGPGRTPEIGFGSREFYPTAARSGASENTQVYGRILDGFRTLSRMDPDDHVCLCFHVSLRKISNFIARENPTVPSQISECLGAGTGCQWCVPFLKKLHALHRDGSPMDLPVSPAEYAKRRAKYRRTGERDSVAPHAGDGSIDGSGDASGDGSGEPPQTQ
jgi:bacterioferritin-associated ferredoxin